MSDAMSSAAAHLATTTFADLPDDAVRATKEHILHTVATMLAGSSAPGCDAIRDLVEDWGGAPDSSVLVYGSRLPATSAVLANSSFGHAHDFDNNEDRLAYKSSITAVGSSLALAEKLSRRTGDPVDGKTLLTAACVGIDFGIRMGLCIQPQPAHPMPWELAAFQAAASSVNILRLDPDVIENAMGLAFGTVTYGGGGVVGKSYAKRLWAGAAGRNGVYAAELAQKGFDNHVQVLEGQFGFYQTVYGTEGDLTPLFDRLGDFYEVVNVGPKPYPCCRYVHGPIDAALDLVRTHDIDHREVTEILVTVSKRDNDTVFGGGRTPGREGDFAVKRRPATIVDAQFSIPYTVATAIVKRRVFLDDFTEEAILDPDVIALSQIVEPVIDLEMDDWDLSVKPCSVEIRTRDGQSYSQRVDYVRGNPRNPVPMDEVRSNFMACAAHAGLELPEDRVAEARDMIENLEEVGDVTQLISLLCAP